MVDLESRGFQHGFLRGRQKGQRQPAQLPKGFPRRILSLDLANPIGYLAQVDDRDEQLGLALEGPVSRQLIIFVPGDDFQARKDYVIFHIDKYLSGIARIFVVFEFKTTLLDLLYPVIPPFV